MPLARPPQCPASSSLSWLRWQRPRASMGWLNTWQEMSMVQEHGGLSEQGAAEIGLDAYIFGYPMVTMEMTRRVMTNTVEPVGMRGPMGPDSS